MPLRLRRPAPQHLHPHWWRFTMFPLRGGWQKSARPSHCLNRNATRCTNGRNAKAALRRWLMDRKAGLGRPCLASRPRSCRCCAASEVRREPTVTVAAADTNVWLLYSCSKRATPKLSFAKASGSRITHSLQWMSWVRLKLLSLAHPRKEMRA